MSTHSSVEGREDGKAVMHSDSSSSAEQVWRGEKYTSGFGQLVHDQIDHLDLAVRVAAAADLAQDAPDAVNNGNIHLGNQGLSNIEKLLSDDILPMIAKNLSVQEMLELRRMSPCWNHAFIPEIKKRHKPIELVCIETKNTLREFTDVMRTCHEVPFSRYKFLLDGSQKSNSDVIEFFSVLASRPGGGPSSNM